MTLRPYQIAAVEAVFARWGEFTRLLGVAPTGSGKTIIFAQIARRVNEAGARVLILAHRDELLAQAQDKLATAAGLITEREQAGCNASLAAPVVVASVQTLCRRCGTWPADHFGAVIVDEAHHATADGYQRVLDRFTSAKVLGVTATPAREDARALSGYFEDIAFKITLPEMVQAGYLAPIRVRTVPLRLDVSNVGSSHGDLEVNALHAALKPHLAAVARAIADFAAFRRTVVFLPLVATSLCMMDECRAAGLVAEHVDGADPDRAGKVARFHAGRTDVITNALLLSEGWDCPDVDCVVVLRPTRSAALYQQMVGRGTRVAPAKENLLLLDFLWHHERFDLARPAGLIAEGLEEAEAVTKELEAEAEEDGSEHDLFDVMGSVREKREEALLRRLRENRKRPGRLLDPLSFAAQVHCAAAAEFKPVFGWHYAVMTDKQRTTLERFGFDLEGVQNRGHASKLLDVLFSRQRGGLATPRQVRLLERLGHAAPHEATFEEAKGWLDRRLPTRAQPAAAHQLTLHEAS